jgi:acyl-homoserine-lactone acylase
MIRRLAVAALAVLTLGCAAHVRTDTDPEPEWGILSRQAEIRRTDYGVPHIRADNLRAAGFGLGWVQLEDHGERIVMGLVDARGESARYAQDGERALDADLLARRAHARALETFPLLPGDVRDIYDGFAAAVNRYVELHPEEFDGPALPRFTGADVSARDIGQPAWTVARRFVSRAESGSPLVASWTVGGGGAARGPGAPDAEADLPGWEAGSNTWAFGPSRTTSGRAILMRNPHLSWTAGYYEAHLTVPGVLNFYGDFRLGGPFGMIGGWNERLGWSSTNNAPQLNDIYALHRDPARPGRYLLDGESLAVESRPVTLEYRAPTGLATETRELLETAIGPVIHQDDERIYVLRTGGDDAYRVGEQFLGMMTASTLEEWQDAMRIQARNASNFTYADADGNIFYVWNAAHPVRPHPHGGDTLAIPVRGRGDVWSEIIPFDRLPQLHNPPGGYLRNENDPFHHTNLNAVMDASSFPQEFPEPRVRLRSQHSIKLVHGDGLFSLDDVWAARSSARMLLADRVKDDLLAAVAAAGASGEVAAAASLLRDWDNTVAADARGAVLFLEWWDRYLAGGDRAPGTPESAGFPATAASLFRIPWSLAEPATTPRGLADPDRAVAAFAGAVADAAERWGGWDVAWGDVHRARVGDLELPVTGCDGLLGCFRVLWFVDSGDGRRQVRGGDGWVSAVEFTDIPRAYTVLAYGQSGRPGHPHHEDQLRLFAEDGRKAVAFTEADIAARMIRSYPPGVHRWDAVAAGPEFDLLLLGGHVLDGSGAPAIRADVAVRDGRIAAVGDLGGAAARVVLQVPGLYVAPGFIDTHSHAAPGLATESLGHGEPLLAQGITTIFANPDGGGAVDLAGQRRSLLEHGIGVNVAQLVPHGSVRESVLGMADRAPDAEELERMRRLVRQGMEAGAFGLSTGPFYAPGSYATTDELAALAAVVAGYGGVHQSHIRDEGEFSVGLRAAVDEVIEISRRTAITGVISHIKALGPDVWGQSRDVVSQVEEARAQGLRIYADQYPYDASATSLSAALVPRWALVGGRDSLVARARHPEHRDRLLSDITANLERRGGPERVQFRRYRPDPGVEGRTLASVAAERGQEPARVAMEMALNGSAGIVSFNMHDDDVVRFMARPWTMTASDGEYVALGEGVPHPRAYGTFPRKLGLYARDRGVVDVPTAIRSMTGLPAEVYGLRDRGLVRTGLVADLVVFDLSRVHDPSTYDDPHRYAEGMVHVLVGGEPVIREGEFTGARPGRVLRRDSRP